MVDNKDIKIVVGANYGDEGKGLATNYFSYRACYKGNSCLNVLYSGGPQRGHSVNEEIWGRHVFHHFGSGTFHGADTYFAKGFKVYPIKFIEEYRELIWSLRNGCVCIHPKCQVITPYDVFVNQIVEKSRKEERHGSCGAGIWETEERYKSAYSLTYEEMASMTDHDLQKFLTSVSEDYAQKRLKDVYGVYDVDDEYLFLFSSDVLKIRYIKDFRAMQTLITTIADEKELLNNYGSIIFEGGQGLALDCRNISDEPYITPGSTGSYVPAHIIKENFDNDKIDAEICYVTRTYFTRHGAGPFPTECHKKLFGNILDITNMSNEFQGDLRYGKFDFAEFHNRIVKDNKEFAEILKCPFETSIMFTHVNESTECFTRDTMKSLVSNTNLAKLYLSNTELAKDVIRFSFQ